MTDVRCIVVVAWTVTVPEQWWAETHNTGAGVVYESVKKSATVDAGRHGPLFAGRSVFDPLSRSTWSRPHAPSPSDGGRGLRAGAPPLYRGRSGRRSNHHDGWNSRQSMNTKSTNGWSTFPRLTAVVQAWHVLGLCGTVNVHQRWGRN